jgi:hypothetical protein
MDTPTPLGSKHWRWVYAELRRELLVVSYTVLADVEKQLEEDDAKGLNKPPIPAHHYQSFTFATRDPGTGVFSGYTVPPIAVASGADEPAYNRKERETASIGCRIKHSLLHDELLVQWRQTEGVVQVFMPVAWHKEWELGCASFVCTLLDEVRAVLAEKEPNAKHFRFGWGTTPIDGFTISMRFQK